MFEHIRSQIKHNSRGGATAGPQNGNTDTYNNLTTFGPLASGVGAIDQSIFEKSGGSTPESNSSEDSSGMPKLSKSSKSYTSEEADDPASVHFRGHASNPKVGNIQGPLTASLSSNGEVEDTPDRASNETEEALIGGHEDHILRAPVPHLKSLSPADWVFSSESPDSSKARGKSYPIEDVGHAGSWNAGQLLGPMEPMKIAKTKRNPLRANVPKLHTLDPSEMSNGELPYIPGVPTHSREISTSQAISGNGNNNSNAPHRDNIVNGKRIWHGTNEHENPHGVFNVKYSKPEGLSSVVSSSEQQNQLQGHSGFTHDSGYAFNDYSHSGSSQHIIPLIADTNGHDQPKFENHTYNHYAQNQKSPLNYESGGALPPLGQLTNGGPLSFLPPYKAEYSSPQHPVATTSAYPVMFSPVYMGSMGSVPAVVPSHSLSPLTSHVSPDHRASQPSVLPANTQVEKIANASNAIEKLVTPNIRGPAPVSVQGRTFKCTQPGCDWSFVRSSDQKRHIRSHQKPSLKCPFWELEPNCNRKGAMFYRSDVLKRHLRLVHLQRSTTGSSEGGVCRICSLPFENSRDFLQHCGSCAKNALALKEGAGIAQE